MEQLNRSIPQQRGRGAAGSAEPDAQKRVLISMMDGFSVGSYITSLTPTSALRIVACLALRGSTPRKRIAGLLWPGVTDKRAQGNLRSALWRLGQDFPGLIESRRGMLSLTADASTDVSRLIGIVCHISSSESYIPEGIDLELLVSLGTLTPEWEDEWVVSERERLRQMQLNALDTLTRRLIAQDRVGAAILTGQAALAADPLRESSFELVIRALLVQGNLAQAHRLFDAFAGLLEAELGVSPSCTIEQLLVEHGRSPERHSHGQATAILERTLSRAPARLEVPSNPPRTPPHAHRTGRGPACQGSGQAKWPGAGPCTAP